ncbi:MAG: 4Fe-4S dicluster domain-containing protein [Peptoniphilaceae bacterium]|nr:4Fe-4S dicluster domain-containing protein [Peptoniphilaceae bacterium]MDD7383286.1 4Fe-4S dicluster domain-containing protein [Peptoniphilaceae bacterium]MDY3738343.1 4Fe-4S dicluster domain-containing protein [Peptoniphilaceae bacterium]
MKESYIDVINIRRLAFQHIASIAYENRPLSDIQKEVFQILPGEEAKYRENIFRERAVMGERLRLTLGLDARTADRTESMIEGIDEIDVDDRVYNPPLVNVIKIACEACKENTVEVSNLCRACLAHPCVNVCPKNAITYTPKGSIIDQDKCIKCGRCVKECPYHAIVHYDRPCSASCGVKAIKSDKLGRAEINDDVCVACGKCIQTCPFGAITDKSEIYQLIKQIQSGKDVYAIIAPSFVGQFGAGTKPEQIFEAIRKLGFKDVIEVGLGADLTTLNEAKEFNESVPEERPFMGTSCCYSRKLMVEKNFPEINSLISDSSTPMVYSAHHIKKNHPDCKVVFIGPCISKKLEALQDNVKDYVDFVITFEELMGMFVAKKIEPNEIEISKEIMDSSKTGRNYAVSGGVADAVVKRLKEINPERKVEIENAEGLFDCVTLVKLASKGLKNGKLLEGMACIDGCIGGPGTVISTARAKRSVKKFSDESIFSSPFDNTNIPDEEKP